MATKIEEFQRNLTQRVEVIDPYMPDRVTLFIEDLKAIVDPVLYDGRDCGACLIGQAYIRRVKEDPEIYEGGPLAARNFFQQSRKDPVKSVADFYRLDFERVDRIFGEVCLYPFHLDRDRAIKKAEEILREI